MGTPTCQIFIPTPHQHLLARELILKIKKVYRIKVTNQLEFIEACYYNGKLLEDGHFKWNDSHWRGERNKLGVTKKVLVDELCFVTNIDGRTTTIHDVQHRKFLICGHIQAVWHQDKLIWELITQI